MSPALFTILSLAIPAKAGINPSADPAVAGMGPDLRRDDGRRGVGRT
jgi:hypothetical protein